MIIVKLQGGLGNQMFQYAFGRTLAEKYNTKLKLDITSYDLSKNSLTNPDTVFNRRYGLNQLQIEGEIASDAEIAMFQGNRALVHRLRAKWLRAGAAYIKERQFNYDESYARPKALARGNTVYLFGYWQTERYFKDCEHIIRREFTWKLPAEKANAAILERIRAVEAVSVHIRRGDFALKKYNDYHGLCPLSYYYNAIETIQSLVSNPVFFVFSDEPDWVRQNVRVSLPMEIVVGNGAPRDYEDLRLMSNCKHHILANSSFSWWGAWLSTCADKTVILPSEIFKNARANICDFAVPGWLKIESAME